MTYKIYPLAITQGHIHYLTEICQEVLGYSPTRGLDEAGLDIKDPASFLSTFALDNKPLEALRNWRAHNLLNHFSVSFVAAIPEYLLAELRDKTPLHTTSKSSKKGCVVILSGTLFHWLHAVVAGCHTHADKDFRVVMTQILNIFDRVGFRELFFHYERNHISDTEIILVRRADRSS